MAQERIVFQMSDPIGDDFGAGKLAYPSHEVFSAGLFDLKKFSVAVDEDYVYFDFQFPVVTNPFQAPEGYFHQRLEVYIDTDPGGNEEIIVGHYRFRTAPKFGWEVRLTVAPFGESRLYLQNTNEMQAFTDGVSSFLLKDEKTIRVQVDKKLLFEPTQEWRYYVLVGSFDGLALDLWRDLGDGSWQVDGEGPPVFDLLAPRWGTKSQKSQLNKALLYPVGLSWKSNLLWIKISLMIVLGAGVAFWSLFLWRWVNDRT